MNGFSVGLIRPGSGDGGKQLPAALTVGRTEWRSTATAAVIRGLPIFGVLT
jgi:hypothetical protein